MWFRASPNPAFDFIGIVLLLMLLFLLLHPGVISKSRQSMLPKSIFIPNI
jgi:hypothetical protein